MENEIRLTNGTETFLLFRVTADKTGPVHGHDARGAGYSKCDTTTCDHDPSPVGTAVWHDDENTETFWVDLNTYEKLAAAKAMAIQIAEAGDGTVREEDIPINLKYRPEESAFMGLAESLEDDGYIVERQSHGYSHGGVFKVVGKSTLPPPVEPPDIDLSLPAEERLLRYLLSGGHRGVELNNVYASRANLYMRAEFEPAMAALRNRGYVIDVVKRYGGWRHRIVGMPPVAEIEAAQ